MANHSMVTQNESTHKSHVKQLGRILAFREAGIIIITIILAVLVTLREPSFLSIDNLTDILMNISLLIIVALAQTLVLLTAGIDLSVESTIGLVAMMVGFFLQIVPNLPNILSILLGIGLGAILGTFNGLIISYGKVPPIIATLGTLSIYRGLVFFYSGGTWINSFELPGDIKLLSKARFLGVPQMILFAILVALVIFLILRFTRFGRDIYAVGSNPDAAMFAGIRKQKIIFLVYVISGLLAGFAAVLWLSYYESAQTNTALGFALQTVTAAVVGGVSTGGGVGGVPGVLLGALLLGIIKKSLTLVRISAFWQLAAQGFLILVAVVTDKLIFKRGGRFEK